MEGNNGANGEEEENFRTPFLTRLFVSLIKRGPKVYTGAVSVLRNGLSARGYVNGGRVRPPALICPSTSHHHRHRHHHHHHHRLLFEIYYTLGEGGGGWWRLRVKRLYASKVQPSRSAVERLHARAIKNGIIPLLVAARREGKDERRKEDRKNERCGFLNQFVGHWCSCSIESLEHVKRLGDGACTRAMIPSNVKGDVINEVEANDVDFVSEP